MLVNNVLIRPLGGRHVSLSWTSDTATTRSWGFINGTFIIGPFMGDAKDRSITVAVPENTVFVVEVHDFEDDTVPMSTEEKPQVRPLIAWNSVDTARLYRVYYSTFDEDETLLCEVPPYTSRMEINCPVKLDGRGGQWYRFRVVAVDEYGNESESEVIPHFATDLSEPPEIIVTRDTETGTFTFRIP